MKKHLLLIISIALFGASVYSMEKKSQSFKVDLYDNRDETNKLYYLFEKILDGNNNFPFIVKMNKLFPDPLTCHVVNHLLKMENKQDVIRLAEDIWVKIKENIIKISKTYKGPKPDNFNKMLDSISDKKFPPHSNFLSEIEIDFINLLSYHENNRLKRSECINNFMLIGVSIIMAIILIFGAGSAITSS